MKKLHMNLYTKILVLVIFVIFISISFVLPFMTELIALNIKDKAEINVMNTAKIVANSPLIREALSRKDPEKLIQAHRITSYNVCYTKLLRLAFPSTRPLYPSSIPIISIPYLK